MNKIDYLIVEVKSYNSKINKIKITNYCRILPHSRILNKNDIIKITHNF